MQRDPSIHITRNQFNDILEALGVSYFPVDAFFTTARRYSMDSRAVIASNKKVTKQIDNITLASHGDAFLVSDLIYATRIKLKHRGVRKITESNQKDWTLCKKLAELCNQFCRDFELETRAGFIKYLEIGINKCAGNNRNLLPRLVSMADNIIAEYEVIVEVNEYTSSYRIKTEVEEIYLYYIRYIAASTGIVEHFKDDNTKYVHFCRVHKLLEEKNWDYKQYITAQFEALSFCNGIPSIDTMYGDKAIERFNRYLYKNHASNSVIDTPEVEGSLWDKIK